MSSDRALLCKARAGPAGAALPPAPCPAAPASRLRNCHREPCPGGQGWRSTAGAGCPDGREALGVNGERGASCWNGAGSSRSAGHCWTARTAGLLGHSSGTHREKPSSDSAGNRRQMRSPQRIGDFICDPQRLWCRPLSHLEMFVCFEVSAGCQRRAGASAGSVCVCEAFAGPQGPLRDTQLGKKVGMR